MKKLTTVFVAFFIVFSVNAQLAVFKKELVKPTQLTYYGLNHLGDTSSIVSSEIAKETVLKTFTFKDPFLGNITQYDERNPFQQLVFYKSTQQLVFLDNQLSVKEKINLTEQYPEIDAVYAALTAQSGIWIFDYASKRWCILSSQQEQPSFVSNPLTTYSFLTTYGNYAYWQNADVIFGIDIYGKPIKEQALPKKAQLLAINGDLLVYVLNNKLFLLHTKKNETEQLTEVNNTIDQVIFNAKSLSVLTADKLYLYHIN